MSKKQHNKIQQEKRDALRGMLAMTATLLTIGLMFGMTLHTDTYTFQRVFAQVDEPTYLCELDVVECDGEEPMVPKQLQRMLDTIPHDTQETANRITYLYEYATEKGVDPEPIAKTIYCESMFYCIQSGVVKDGVQEPSYCLAQIHAPSHPELTSEQLWDPYFNIRYITDHYFTDTWYGYDRETDSCTNGLPEYWK